MYSQQLKSAKHQQDTLQSTNFVLFHIKQLEKQEKKTEVLQQYVKLTVVKKKVFKLIQCSEWTIAV